MPPHEVDYAVQYCKRRCDQLQLGDDQLLLPSSQTLDDKPTCLTNDKGLSQTVTFAPILDLLFRRHNENDLIFGNLSAVVHERAFSGEIANDSGTRDPEAIPAFFHQHEATHLRVVAMRDGQPKTWKTIVQEKKK